MSLYNNFGEETNADVVWKKIDIMFENKNAVNKVSVFKKIMRLRYHDDYSMVQHINAFQGLMNQTTSLEVTNSSRWGVCTILAWIPSGQLGDACCHTRQCGTGRETFIPRAGEVDLVE